MKPIDNNIKPQSHPKLEQSVKTQKQKGQTVKTRNRLRHNLYGRNVGFTTQAVCLRVVHNGRRNEFAARFI